MQREEEIRYPSMEAGTNERLRHLRKERGLTQVQTAEHLSIAWRNYQRLEKDGNAPSFLTFVKAAEFFGVSLDYLAGRTDRRDVWK